MHRFLWILQIVMGLYFLSIGIMHFLVPPGLPAAMSWMYDLSTGLHWLAGILEILGGLGLILPGLFGIRPNLTPLAAAGLTLVMIGAVAYHLQRGEAVNIGMNVILAALLLTIAYGRWRARPLRA